MENKKRKIDLKLSNRLFYTLVVFSIIILGAVGVYAWGTTVINAGVVPEPGHDIDELQVP